MAWTTLRATGSADIDLGMARTGFAVLADQENGAYLCEVPSGRSFILQGSNLDGLCQAAHRLAHGRVLYLGLNPVPLSLEGHPKVGDILKRRWVMVDVDSSRPDTKVMATDQEHETAREVAFKVVEHLAGKGWPAPVILDSGNGFHLLYRADLENTKYSTALLGAFLKSLRELFKEEAGAVIDPGTNKATNNTKVPGSMARKDNPATPERPYRRVAILNAPDPVELVSLEQLQEVAGEFKTREEGPRTVPAKDPFKLTAVNGDGGRAYARRALAGEVAKLALSRPVAEGGDGRNNALWRAGCNMGELIAGGCIFQQEVEGALFHAAWARGLPEKEINATLARAIEQGKSKPRTPPQPTPNGEAKREDPPPAAGQPEPENKEDSVIVRASDITPRRVEWLWPGRIPLGKLTTFAGIGGLGKTFVILDTIARLTTGRDWPDSLGVCCEPGQALFISGEDDPEDTLVPRLLALGADLGKVAFLHNKFLDKFCLANIEVLDKAIDQLGGNVRLVGIDPPSSFMGAADDHRNAEVRALLTPLKSWVAKRHLALIFNTHFNKSGGAKIEAVHRVMASVAWVNAVRAAHAFAPDPEDSSKVIFVPMKMNLAKRKKGLAYRIEDHGEDQMATLSWLGEVDLDADQVVNREAKKRAVKASVWLEELFKEQDQIASKVIWEGRKRTTISENALKEAKDEMGLKAKQDADPDGAIAWFWYWPATAKAAWHSRKKERDEEPF